MKLFQQLPEVQKYLEPADFVKDYEIGEKDFILASKSIYDKYFKDGDVNRNPLTEFNSSNTELLDVEQVKAKLLELKYIRDEIAEWENR